MRADVLRIISDALYKHLEVREGFEGPPRTEHDCCAGTVLTALRDAGIRLVEDEPVQSYCCPGGCDCSCCYGYPDRDCHCFTYPCNCCGGPAEHGAAVGGVTGEASHA